MSNWSQRSQYQPEISNGYGITDEYNDPQDRVLSQPYPSPNQQVTISSTINLNLNLNTSASQQFRETTVTVNLFDCMQCYIPLSRYEVPQYINSFDKSTQTDFTDREEKDLSENEEDDEEEEEEDDDEEEEDPFVNTTFEINVYHQMEEFRQEQENRSPHPSNPTVPPPTPEEEGALLGLSWDMDDYGFMESYVFMNKP